MIEVNIGPGTATLHPKEQMLGVMFQDIELSLKRSITLTFSMLDKFLMVLVELDISLGLGFCAIMQVILVYHQVFIVMVIPEVDIGLTPDNFPHINMVD